MAEDRKDEPSGAQSVVPKGRIRRTAPMAGFAARTAGERVVAALRAKAGNETAKAEFHERTAERYADLLGHSKGVLMKAGQLLSFVDLGSGDPTSSFGIYQAALERLQADAPPMDADTAREVVESELGKPIDELFARFEPEPMAAASIGQVHEAELHDGRKVAVKVQYPGVADAIHADLANTELLATFMQLGTSMVPKYTRVRQRPAAREISARIAEEVDYHHEARNIDRFADAYRGHPFIRIPDVVTDVSTRRVLTMTFVEGLDWTSARQAEQDLKDRWGEILYRFAIGTYRRFGLFNADPHPGNYRFGLDGSVGFVDFGCVKTFTAESRAPIQGFIRATIENDASRLKQALIDGGMLDADTELPADRILDWYRNTQLSLTAPQPFTYTPEHAAQVVHRQYDPTSEWHDIIRHFDLPPDFVFFTRIDLGLNSVLGELRATAPWRAILDELDGVGPPATELGRLDAEWAASRGERQA